MQPKLQKKSVWILTIFLLTIALLVLGFDDPYFIGFAIMFLPFLLLLQAWYILREPHDDKNHPEDRWYDQ